MKGTWVLRAIEKVVPSVVVVYKSIISWTFL